MAKRLKYRESKMRKVEKRPQFSKNMDTATKYYFKSSDREFAARGDAAIGPRQDLSSAFCSDRGRKLRRFLAEKGVVKDFGRIPQGMERAIGVSALWLQWKERQTGKPVRLDEIPPHCMPAAGPVTFNYEETAA